MVELFIINNLNFDVYWFLKIFGVVLVFLVDGNISIYNFEVFFGYLFFLVIEVCVVD